MWERDLKRRKSKKEEEGQAMGAGTVGTCGRRKRARDMARERGSETEIARE